MAPPKKREKETTNAGGAAGGSTAASGGGSTNTQTNADATKLNGHQQEQELFLQAFEKPTQIYRFLRNRHGTSPIFLNRTLSYMKDRMSRNNKKRSTFKINSILDRITNNSESISNNYLNVIYNGLFDKSTGSDQWWNAGEVVCVESTLYKITKSKRKDSTSDFQEVLSHSSNVIYNPHEDIGQFSAISIPVQSMRPLGDQHTIYKLLFRIKITSSITNKKEDNVENDETPSKRSKGNTKIYGCELIVFEKNLFCIPEGDYEAALQELSSMSIKSFSPKKRTWETLPDNYIPLSMKFDVFNQFPTLKFRLTWSSAEIPSSIDAKDLNKYGGFVDAAMENSVATTTNGIIEGESQINHNNNCIKGLSCKEKIQIVYNFLYSNNTRQQTEYTQEVICPWCGLDCLRLYALLKHLKLCHARFNFTYQPAGNGARIDVTINDSYDGSYAGSPYDLAGPSGCSFARTCGPVRRTSVTNLLVCRPRRQKTCLDEFLVLDEDDLSNQRPYITGHNRLYHHTETCLPVHPKELDIDSEGESDPLWLRQKTIQMIDEFSDVNEGEKELMKLWNLHVMKHGYVGDCQLPLACEMFLNSNGHEVIRKNLYRNFILHMCSLFDYGLVSPETFYKTVQKLQGMLSKYSEGQELMSKQRETQLKYWLDIGIHKQDEQKLKSPQKQPPPPPCTVIAAVDDTNTAANTVSTTTTTVTVGAVAASLDIKTTMHPPAKRSATAVKRASMHPQNGLSAAEKLANSGGGSGPSKSVAKKSATQEENHHNITTREKRSEIGIKRNSLPAAGSSVSGGGSTEKDKSDNKATDKTRTSDTKSQAVKRRLSIKDAHQPVTKRNRSDSHVGASAVSLSTSTRSAAQKQLDSKNAINNTSTNSNPSSTLNSTTLPKRLITRRQSIAGTSSNLTASEQHHTTGTKNERTSGGGKVATTTHSLRTRLSVPLTKVDKR